MPHETPGTWFRVGLPGGHWPPCIFPAHLAWNNMIIFHQWIVLWNVTYIPKRGYAHTNAWNRRCGACNRQLEECLLPSPYLSQEWCRESKRIGITTFTRHYTAFIQGDVSFEHQGQIHRQVAATKPIADAQSHRHPFYFIRSRFLLTKTAGLHVRLIKDWFATLLIMPPEIISCSAETEIVFLALPDGNGRWMKMAAISPPFYQIRGKNYEM
jgi:hypothetical protein